MGVINPINEIREIHQLIADPNKFSSFQDKGFLETFTARIQQIVMQLPESENRKNLEIELAYIIKNIEERFGLILMATENSNLVLIRTLEKRLFDLGLLTQYRHFSEGKSENEEGLDFTAFPDYLAYLYAYSTFGIKHVQYYLQTCIRLSQIEGGVDILMSHFNASFDQIPQKDIDAMVKENQYLGSSDLSFDDHVQFALEDDSTLSWNEACMKVEVFQGDMAAFHILLADFYNSYIESNMDHLNASERIKLHNLLNDLRDIIDPEGYMPLYFHNGNWLETGMREVIEREGRIVH